MPEFVPVPLSLFGGSNTDIAPVDCPEGVSPDNQDVMFRPGEVFSRYCTHKILNPSLANTPTVLYMATTHLPNGNPLTLLLDSNGVLWTEDPVNSPGVPVNTSTVTAGVLGFSCTIDGVGYLTFHDGLHGVDVPLQYNNGIIDRISQDSVGAPPTSAVDVTTKVNITSVTLSNLAAISTANEDGNVVTITTATPHGLAGPGVFVNIAGVSVAGYNGGAYQVGQVVSATVFTVINAGTGLANGAGGTMGLAQVTVVTATAHGLNVGDAAFLEGNDGSFNNGANTTSGTPTPQYWTVIQVVNPTTFIFGLSGPSGTINTTTLNNGTNAGTVAVGGMISAGTHQIAISFLYRSGYITKPSPVLSWTCVGNRQAKLTGIPTGPAGLVVGRIIHLTGAGGGRFFYQLDQTIVQGNSLLFNNQLAPATIVQSTLIPDNVTTTFTLDIPDNVLFAGIGADIPGNNLFALHKLQPCLGAFFYASRLWSWGEWNSVDDFLNMGFEGGIITANQPLGWGTFGAGGALVNSPRFPGLAWQITGDGTNTGRGTITQSAYQNYLKQTILQPNTLYGFRCWAQASAANLSGTIAAFILSQGTGFSALVSININTVSTTGQWVSGTFSAATPAVIPADLEFLVESGFNLNNGATITLDEMTVYFANQPYRDSLFRVSYVNNFESFDGVTGALGPTEDATPIRCATVLRSTMYFQTAERLHETSDTGLGEPSEWDVNEVAQVGAMSVYSMSPVAKGEEWFFTVSNGASGRGLYIFDGGGPYKVSQEYQQYFDGINNSAMKTVWLVNDPVERRVHIGTPQGTAPTPNLLLAMDYREMDQPGQIAGSPPIHISFTGKMISSDLTRKWTRWNLTLNCGGLINRGGNVIRFCVGAGNGQAVGSGSGFGNIYFLDSTKLTDDDFGAMNPYYVPYFFTNHEQEIALGLGAGRKRFCPPGNPLSVRVLGVGTLTITPLVNELTNALPGPRPIALTSTLNFDHERNFLVAGERCSPKITIAPLAGQTDVQFILQKLVMRMSMEGATPIQGPR